MSDWIPVGEATGAYSVSRATLYRLIAEGRVRRAKKAGDVRAYVHTGDLKQATTLRVVPPRGMGGRRGGGEGSGRRRQPPGV